MQVILALSSCGEIIGQSGLKDAGASRTLKLEFGTSLRELITCGKSKT